MGAYQADSSEHELQSTPCSSHVYQLSGFGSASHGMSQLFEELAAEIYA